ncbi:MAG: 6-phosphofructokinase [Parcubacteria group bacterium CG11_big_fil_rev_8_21_14_0_20_39_14]|nr:MAG: 6-phosphofructokinase [Parcubacteria group bacterium CG11_big_fil_rev_8_21_14_0_20_39_14]PIS35424.1 MAG: 6-phosphofructokinase [Parcubacteria group bacterium CG08_land_8_20_14_0_20_38_56]
MKRIGILTGGGDCPGLNAAIRAAAKKGFQLGFEMIGIKNGWKGMLMAEAEILTYDKVSGLLHKGGTILGSSRTNPAKIENGLEKVVNNFKELKLDALIVIGGEDTLGVAVKISKEVSVVGIPKTIDNDVGETDFCIGFHTAVQTASDIIDKIHPTAESHHRVIVLEVMGRHVGWIATYAGMAGGADFILIPEIPIDINDICETIEKRVKKGRDFSIIVIAEGVKIEEKYIVKKGETDAFGHVILGGVGEILAEIIKEKTKIETRAINLGHIVRGGSPTAFDRILATRFGVKAIELVSEKKFGRMAAINGSKIIDVPIEKALEQKRIDKDLYETAKVFF